MAAKTPTVKQNTTEQPYISIVWDGITEADTGASTAISYGKKRGTAVIAGTFGGGTYNVQVSLDGTDFANLKDLQGSDVSATTSESFEFETVGKYFQVTQSGGSSADVNVHLELTNELS